MVYFALIRLSSWVLDLSFTSKHPKRFYGSSPWRTSMLIVTGLVNRVLHSYGLTVSLLGYSLLHVLNKVDFFLC